jgi:hypothetical protein
MYILARGLWKIFSTAELFTVNIATGMNSEVWCKKRTIRLKTIYWSTNEPFTTDPFDAACHKVQTPT